MPSFAFNIQMHLSLFLSMLSSHESHHLQPANFAGSLLSLQTVFSPPFPALISPLCILSPTLVTVPTSKSRQVLVQYTHSISMASSSSVLLLHLCRLLFQSLLFTVVFIQSQQVHGQSMTTSFNFESFSSRDLTLLGDSFFQNANLYLTRNFSSIPASSSAGRALYTEPVRFLDSTTNSSASFHTEFSFSVTNRNSISTGDGLAFIIVPDNKTLGSPAQWLGLLNATQNLADPGPPRFVAVEFDTYLDVDLFDINDNHVGLDLGSLVSIGAADIGTLQMDLKSGDVISAWIDYNSSAGVLEVRMSYSGQRPDRPLLRANVSLSNFMNEFMFVGFSASTDTSEELHSVYTWSFSTSGLNLVLPPSAAPSSSPPPSQFSALVPPSIHEVHCRGAFCLNIGAFSGLSVGTAVFLAFIILAIIWCAYKNWKALKGSRLTSSDSFFTGPRKFSYKELSVATKGFSSSKEIGHGAFGTVYKGVLPDTRAAVAVKRSVDNNEGKSEFLAELSIIGCLRHRNLVQLLGWCHEKDEILLVYEFMAQGSLDKLLFDKNAPVLRWMHRYKIVTGISAALAYLHDEYEQQVVHRDVKASNIMLDSSFNARLGDFGLARLTDHNKSPDATLTAGTMGYLAPEYIHTGKASEKTDVFSFGAVVLEVACGRRPLEKDLSPKENVLVDWVWGLHRFDKLVEAADPRLAGEFGQDEMKLLLQVGLLCSHPDPVGRPTMRHVLQILTGQAPLPHVPLFKPIPSFAILSLPVSLQDIISDSRLSVTVSSPSDSS